jgi:hypothetical protein
MLRKRARFTRRRIVGISLAMDGPIAGEGRMVVVTAHERALLLIQPTACCRPESVQAVPKFPTPYNSSLP